MNVPTFAKISDIIVSIRFVVRDTLPLKEFIYYF